MGRKLTWKDVFDSLPDYDKRYYAEVHEDMCFKANHGFIEESKELANKIQAWEKRRWDVAESNILASNTTIWS